MRLEADAMQWSEDFKPNAGVTEAESDEMDME